MTDRCIGHELLLILGDNAAPGVIGFEAAA
jgi:hypothetical protein